jgi:3-oxoadipate enol-lactonase
VTVGVALDADASACLTDGGAAARMRWDRGQHAKEFGMSSIDTATARDGTRIAYSVIPGRGKGRLALAHSLAMDHSFWSRTAHFLSGPDILVYDCRGHGRSGKPKGPYTIESAADDLADLMSHVGWTRACVAGASMGGCISLAFAVRYPQKTTGLGLIDTTAWYGADSVQKWEERGQQGFTQGMASLLGFQLSRWLSDAFRERHPEIVEEAKRVFVGNDPAAYLETCRMLGAADLRAGLASIVCPTRVVVGAEDYATPPAMAAALEAGIPHATLRIIEGVRHFTPLECPQLIAEELSRLLDAP